MGLRYALDHVDPFYEVALDNSEKERYSLGLSVAQRKGGLSLRRENTRRGETPDPYYSPALILSRFVGKWAALIKYQVGCYARTYEGEKVEAENMG